MTDEDPTPDPFAELRARIHEAKEAAERLHRETAEARGAAADGVPLRGWATPDDRRGHADEVHALAQLVGTLRDLLPPDFQTQLNDLIRQLLLLMRAIIDWAVERIVAGGEPGTPGQQSATRRPGADGAPRVEDIPIG